MGPDGPRWVPIRGGRLYVDITGSGPPLLMIHGWPLDHRIFNPQVGNLKKDLTLIRYDRRGFGKSDADDLLLIPREDRQEAGNGLEGVLRVEGGDDCVTGLCCLQGCVDGLCVTHLPNEDDVRILPKGGPESRLE